MSSRRNLKKNINKTIGILFADCLIYKLYVVDADQQAADTVIDKLLEVQSEFTKRVSINEGKEVKGRVSQYYKKLKSDFAQKINEIGQEIASL
ncbi:hypothetical protein D0T66_00645 [Dysgonomonas sp. 25]|nr:hypothetical protein [Dysgonomonas sp. 25]